MKLWQYREGMVYLSPAPLYHSAPQAAVASTIRNGGTVVIMEHFDPEQYLQLIEKYRVTHSQLVPTMFCRMLKLPDDVRARYDLSSLRVCDPRRRALPGPGQGADDRLVGPDHRRVLRRHRGPRLHAPATAREWLAHPGTVGRVLLGELHVLDDDDAGVPDRRHRASLVQDGDTVRVLQRPGQDRATRSADGTMSTVGDVGYVDDDGFLFLTDRATFMIISGGVNIYPQECENLLITHPKVADAAVFGVPNDDLGEEVKAVVQLMPGVDAEPGARAELIAFCRAHLAQVKCPRTIDFVAELPRLPTGKLYKRLLRDRYWRITVAHRVIILLG